MTAEVAWYVVAKEPEEYQRTEVFGPFMNEIDARSYAIDTFGDNGWESVEPTLMTHEQATDMATDKVIWPYKNLPDENDE